MKSNNWKLVLAIGNRKVFSNEGDLISITSGLQDVSVEIKKCIHVMAKIPNSMEIDIKEIVKHIDENKYWGEA